MDDTQTMTPNDTFVFTESSNRYSLPLRTFVLILVTQTSTSNFIDDFIGTLRL